MKFSLLTVALLVSVDQAYCNPAPALSVGLEATKMEKNKRCKGSYRDHDADTGITLRGSFDETLPVCKSWCKSGVFIFASKTSTKYDWSSSGNWKGCYCLHREYIVEVPTNQLNVYQYQCKYKGYKDSDDYDVYHRITYDGACLKKGKYPIDPRDVGKPGKYGPMGSLKDYSLGGARFNPGDWKACNAECTKKKSCTYWSFSTRYGYCNTYDGPVFGWKTSDYHLKNIISGMSGCTSE